jgi:hypothetical protein
MLRALRYAISALVLSSCAGAQPTSPPHDASITCTALSDCSVMTRAVACEQRHCVDAEVQRSAGASAPSADGGADRRVLDADTTSMAADSGAPSHVGCHTMADCADAGMSNASNVLCVAPYQQDPSSGCGGVAPWCGFCSCPPQPTPPLGNGQTCQTAADCPVAASAGRRFAGVCGPDSTKPSPTKVCQQCVTNADCSGALPVCGRETESYQKTYPTCVECVADTDCPSNHPHCVAQPGLGGKCRQCASTADCSDGVCSDAGCVPGCTSDNDCPDPLAPCSVHSRCEAIHCASTTGCPAHSQCSAAGVCARTSCTVDHDCGTGICVNGACYGMPGHCFSQFFPP